MTQGTENMFSVNAIMLLAADVRVLNDSKPVVDMVQELVARDGICMSMKTARAIVREQAANAHPAVRDIVSALASMEQRAVETNNPRANRATNRMRLVLAAAETLEDAGITHLRIERAPTLPLPRSYKAQELTATA